MLLSVHMFGGSLLGHTDVIIFNNGWEELKCNALQWADYGASLHNHSLLAAHLSSFQQWLRVSLATQTLSRFESCLCCSYCSPSVYPAPLLTPYHAVTFYHPRGHGNYFLSCPLKLFFTSISSLHGNHCILARWF